MKTTLPTARNHGLDTLRAIAIVLVVLHHYVLFVSGTSTFGWLGDIGWVGVDLFFALSGYLIGNQIFTALRSKREFSLKRFYARRLLRTVPAFYAVLALYYLWPGFRAGSPLLPVWQFLTFTQNFNLQPGTAFSHAWSLCIEEQFYMVLPALALFVGAAQRSLRWAWILIACAFVGGAIIRYLLWNRYVGDSVNGGTDYYKYIYYSTFCRFDELVAGVALALLKNFHPRRWRMLTSHGNVLLAAGIAVSALAFWMFLANRKELDVTVLGFPLLALGFSLLIAAALSRKSLLRGSPIPGAGKLALWSYSIYLTHKQFCILAREPLEKLGYGPESLVAIVAMMALSVFTGWVLYRCVERPFMALRERYVPSNFRLPALTPR